MAIPVLGERQVQSRTSYLYEFVESHEFPALDLSRSLGSVCYAVGKWKQYGSSNNVVTPIPQASSTWEIRLGNVSVSRSTVIRHSGFFIGLILIIAVSCSPAEYGGPMAVIATALSLPSSLAALSIIRYDIMQLSLKSYEFWYSVMINSITCGLIGAYFGDLRAIQSVVLWLGYLNNTFVDAKTLEIQKSVVANISAAATNLVVFALIQWGLVPSVRHFAIFHYRNHVLSVEDIIVNELATTTIVLVRNAIRRVQDLREQKRIKCNMLRCVSYRCTIKLQLLEDELATQSIVPGSSSLDRLPKFQKRKHKINEIIYIDSGVVYDASQTLYPVELNGKPWPKWQRLLLLAIGIFGIALTIFGFGAVSRWSSKQTRWLFAGGLAFTECFSLLMWGMSQVKILRETILSFDFFFLSLQLTCAHLCVCDMFSWDARCLGMLTCWLWVHFVLTADALTPVVRKKLGLQTWHLAVPVLIFIAGQILLACEIIFGNHWDLRDRKIHAITVGDRSIEYRIITFFFSRLATIFLWSWRLLWRIAVAQSDDVVMLRGKVAYAYMNDPELAVGSDYSERDHRVAPAPSGTTTKKQHRPQKPAKHRKIGK